MEAVGIRSPGKSFGRIKFVRACRYLAGALTLAATLALAGCYGPPTQRDALMGGAIGAGSGALIGSAVDHPFAGALIGGAGGAGAGYLYGQHEEHEWRQYPYYGGY
ncbi:MAG TPA: YMGG-like glycine zipper-containing protein [Candidatus Binataceae bacterium]|nr:YMGG-like glycine zipper-containing protein [Candidatus Binataceae bacterium]